MHNRIENIYYRDWVSEITMWSNLWCNM